MKSVFSVISAGPYNHLAQPWQMAHAPNRPDNNVAGLADSQK
jgi:hypothetical protein